MLQGPAHLAQQRLLAGQRLAQLRVAQGPRAPARAAAGQRALQLAQPLAQGEAEVLVQGHLLLVAALLGLGLGLGQLPQLADQLAPQPGDHLGQLPLQRPVPGPPGGELLQGCPLLGRQPRHRLLQPGQRRRQRRRRQGLLGRALQVGELVRQAAQGRPLLLLPGGELLQPERHLLQLRPLPLLEVLALPDRGVLGHGHGLGQGPQALVLAPLEVLHLPGHEAEQALEQRGGHVSPFSRCRATPRVSRGRWRTG